MGNVRKVARGAGATWWSFAVASLMKTFAVWRLAVWQLATACGTCNGQQQQQWWQWRWRWHWQQESGNQPCYGSLAVSHPAPSVHLSLSLSPSSICRGPVQRLRLRLRQMATATGITALRCTWNSCRCSCCCCCCFYCCCCHPFVLLPSLFDSNRIICSVCIRSLISRISQMCVYSPLSSLLCLFSLTLLLSLPLSIWLD